MRPFRLSFLVALTALVAGCAMVDEAGRDQAQAATSNARTPVRLDVGAEARDLPVLTAGRFSLANAYVLGMVSDAAYASSEPERRSQMLDVLCDAGMEVEGHRCVMAAERDKVTVVPFDSDEGDNHAIYIGNASFGIVAFRGTASMRNWMTNFSLAREPFGPSGIPMPESDMEVHGGFGAAAYRVFENVLPGRFQSLRDFVLERHATSATRPMPPPLYVTGHSLGGAMATIAVAAMLLGECTSFAAHETFGVLRSTGPASELRWALPDTHCPAAPRLNLQALYTYGAPRSGNRAFAETVANLMAVRHVAHWRIVHDEDLVTLAPARSLGYSHLHLNIHGVPERRGNETFDLREDEDVELTKMPILNGRRACGQKPGVAGLPEACPIGSWVYLIPDPQDRPPEDRPLDEILRVGVGAKKFMDKETALNGQGYNVLDHFLEGYEGVLGRLARRATPPPSPSKACEDAADAIAEAAPRCGGDAKAARDAFIQSAAGGACTNVTSVRDLGAFYGTCLPSFRSMSCDDLMRADFAKECLAQLRR